MVEHVCIRSRGEAAVFSANLLFPRGALSSINGIEDCVRFASACGLLTCLGEGAIENQPDYSKVNEFLGSQIL